jgi:antitoxin HigA-1
MARLRNIHPGEVLQEEFLVPFDISAYRLSKDTGIPQTRIAAILKGHRRITANTALRLSIYFGTTPKFWLGLQNDYDMEEERHSIAAELKKLRPFKPAKKRNLAKK